MLQLYIILYLVQFAFAGKTDDGGQCNADTSRSICQVDSETNRNIVSGMESHRLNQTSNLQYITIANGRDALQMHETSATATMPTERTLPPNIILVLFDDLGYHDLGTFSEEKRDQCNVPVMSYLIQNGIKLGNFYSLPICSPTRAAIMSGRYPIRYGGHVGTANGPTGERTWLPKNEPFLAERLKNAGYVTKMSGKWHLGHSQRQYTPTFRGFQEFYGKYHGGGDHWTHTLDINADTRDGSVWPGHPQYKAATGPLDLHHDRWVNGKHIHQNIFDQNGTHSSDVIGIQAARMVLEHKDKTKPLFLYIAFQAPHWPVQNPSGTAERNLHITGKQRRKWCGLVSHIDDNVGRVVAALKANDNMWENTIFIALSDNGGDIRTGASNHPYRGDKMTPWEGGTKSPTFIYSPNDNLIPASLRGTTSHVLGHVTDLFPTLLNIAKGDASPTPTGPLDGVDLWSAWRSGSDESPRKELLYNIDPVGLAIVGSRLMTGRGFGVGENSVKKRKGPSPLELTRMATKGNVPEVYSAIRVGKWKLIQGYPGRGDWYGTDPSQCWKAKWIMGPDATNYDLLESGGQFLDKKLGDGGQVLIVRRKGNFKSSIKHLWLFDLEKDPAEHIDIASQFPEKVKELQTRIKYHQNNMAMPIITKMGSLSKGERNGILKQFKARFKKVEGSSHLVGDCWEEEILSKL